MPKPESLVDEILSFAATRRRGGALCWTCTNLKPKLLADIHEAKERGASVAAITEWLDGKGIFPEGTVSQSAIGNHFRSGHRPVA